MIRFYNPLVRFETAWFREVRGTSDQEAPVSSTLCNETGPDLQGAGLPADAASAEDLIAAAQRALTDAKRLGRNRVSAL